MPAQEKNQKESPFKENSASAKVTETVHEPERKLFGWTAPARPFKRMNREFWITILAMATIVGLVLFFAEGFMPVILVVSIIFLVYVMTTVEPEKINYLITNKGIKIGEKRINWQVLIRFWFAKRLDSPLLVIQKFGLPDRLELVVNPEDKEKIEETLLKYIPKEKASASSLDKAVKWFSNKIPGI